MDPRIEIDRALKKAIKVLEEANRLAESHSTDLRDGPVGRLRSSAHSMVVNLAMARKVLDDQANQ